MVSDNFSKDEISRRGLRLYEDRIRATVEPTRFGDYLVIDIQSGDYEVDADHLAASDRMMTRRPQGVLFALRIGQESLGRIGVRGVSNNS